MTPVTKLPLFSTTLAANLPPVGKFCLQFRWCCWFWWQICHQCQQYRQQICHGVNDAGGKLPLVLPTLAAICHRCQFCKVWEQDQTADNLKWTWKKKFIYANSTTQRCPKEIMKTFLHWRFFQFATGVNDNDTGWCTLSCEYLREFSKNLKQP